MNASLHELNSRTGTPLGPMWTTLVVAQLAVAVAVLPVAVYLSWQLVRMEVSGPGFAAEEFVVGTLALSDDASAADKDRVRARQLELMSRLQAEPGVTAVTFSSSVPGFAPSRRVQFETHSASLGARPLPVQEAGTLEVSTLEVNVDMFDIYDAGVVAGRGFSARDLGAANAVVVNRTFVEEFIGPSTTLSVHHDPATSSGSSRAKSRDEHGRGVETRSALGLRFRYSQAPTPQSGSAPPEWYEIVGVVHDFPNFSPAPGSDGEPTVYHLAAPGDVHPVVLSVRFGGGIPNGFSDRFRQIGAEVHPALQLRRVVLLSQFYDDVRLFWRYLAWGIGLVTTSVLLLSAAGIYALMSFTVAQRTREIGIRSALGAHPRRLLLSIFGRALRQLGLGVLTGSLLSGVLSLLAGLSLERVAALLLVVALIMLAVGLLAAFGPARRSLRIQAIEALRAEG